MLLGLEQPAHVHVFMQMVPPPRGPQSAQSVAYGQLLDADPGPPSEQMPEEAYRQVFEQDMWTT